MNKRAYNLYRVSTLGQVEKDDIPMQRQVCREFAVAQGWEIVKELTEKGVSGFKVSAKDRDAIQEIQKDAALGKFDVLLVFMFDRLGRKEDETPFVVEWFVKNGIEVWSATEGQQRFDNHVDKLMNYIRYWQASGESIKTSIRTKTRLGQIVQEGKFRGGGTPYGYQLVKRGRTGKKNRELYDIEINEAEAIIVRKIFDKCINYGYGGRRIASSLKDEGILNRSGGLFHYSTIQNILKNVMYMGILRSGETQSEIFPELQIIDEDTFQRASEIIKQRSINYQQQQRSVPRKTTGGALLSGNVYCGHCGGRIFATTARKSHHAVSSGVYERIPIYKCYNRTQHKELCDGPTTYRASIVDSVIREMLTDFFDKVKGVQESELINQRFQAKMKEYSIQLKKAKTEYTKKAKELSKLDAMMLGASEGTSEFTPARLTRRMNVVEGELEAFRSEINTLEMEMTESSMLLDQIRQEHKRFVSWANVFADASIETQKMIASYMIKSVSIGQDYELNMEFNFDEEQYTMGMSL